jgi:hypothetical protein
VEGIEPSCQRGQRIEPQIHATAGESPGAHALPHLETRGAQLLPRGRLELQFAVPLQHPGRDPSCEGITVERAGCKALAMATHDVARLDGSQGERIAGCGSMTLSRLLPLVMR